ncbi:basic blue protein-like [Cucurbita pepo subsp. pepo]|uniref:basic blue protein-like n=1 Tax=Cucurbita pepo subsp. pepo TaxID=3664 RepID=UPI000C9D9404|nr:basic blue protein-like [Cucurbita pepo subsp. pepo]
MMMMMVKLLMFLSFGGLSMCEVFLVGDEEGWNSGINFATWSQNHNFTKGDFLVFNYAKSVHNVYEVTEETFRSCETSNGVLGEYESGNDQIELKEARKYWFICNVAGHCLGGMRFGIDVKQPNSTSHLPPSPVQSPPPPTNHGSNHGSYAIWSTFMCIIAFQTLFV